MYLTDNAYYDFGIWYIDIFSKSDTGGQSTSMCDKSKMNLTRFNVLPMSMRYGVYTEFFDTVGLELVDFNWRSKYQAALYLGADSLISSQIGKDKGFKKRDLARNFVVNKANDYYNDNYTQTFQKLIQSVWVNINKK